MYHTNGQQQPNNEPAAVAVTPPDLDCEIFNLEKALHYLRNIQGAGEILNPNLFFHTAKLGFYELDQSDFHFNLSLRIQDMIAETVEHYALQLSRLYALKQSNNSKQ